MHDPEQMRKRCGSAHDVRSINMDYGYKQNDAPTYSLPVDSNSTIYQTYRRGIVIEIPLNLRPGVLAIYRHSKPPSLSP